MDYLLVHNVAVIVIVVLYIALTIIVGAMIDSFRGIALALFFGPIGWIASGIFRIIELLNRQIEIVKSVNLKLLSLIEIVKSVNLKLLSLKL